MEIALNIPRVSPNTFQSYCNEIDFLSDELQRSGFDSIRPYTHETSIQIILGIAATFTLVEFLRGFLGELGKQLASFVGKAVDEYRDDGITEVEIKAEKKSITGDTFVIFVTGSNINSITQRLADLIRVVEAKEHMLEIGKETVLNGNHWRAMLRIQEGTNMISILFLAANPSDATRLRLGEEVREIDQALRKTEFRGKLDIKQHWAVRVSDLQGYLLRHKPHLVHFSGHGSKLSEIILEDNSGRSHPVSVRALSKLFSVLKDNIRCVVLNACYSEPQARAIAEHIDCVIGMSKAIGDAAAISFAKAFYEAIGYGKDVKTAFELGCNLIDLENLDEQDTPRLLAINANPEEIILAHDR